MARNVAGAKQPTSVNLKRLEQAITKTAKTIESLKTQLEGLENQFEVELAKLAPGDRADLLYIFRETVRKTTNAAGDTGDKILKTHSEAMIEELRDNMKTQKLSGAVATAAVHPKDVGNIHDWDEFAKFVYRNKALYLLERRIANTAFNELRASRKGKDIPGSTVFTKYTLGLTKAGK